MNDNGLADFLAFRKMVTPLVIQILFWIGAVLAIMMGVAMMVSGVATMRAGGILMVLMGLVYILVGPLIVRIYCEVLIVLFRINETLTEIRNTLRSGPPSYTPPVQ